MESAHCTCRCHHQPAPPVPGCAPEPPPCGETCKHCGGPPTTPPCPPPPYPRHEGAPPLPPPAPPPPGAPLPGGASELPADGRAPNGRTDAGGDDGKPPAGDPTEVNWLRARIHDRVRGGPSFGPRKDEYLPYLVVRSNPSDRGARPVPGVFWES